LCPHCRGHLRVGDNIIFKIRNTRRERGLLLLHPEARGYTSMKHPQFQFKEGERIDFFCPICYQHLDAAMDENLIQVVMVDHEGAEHDIFFSRITGERSTFQLSKESKRETGEISHRYTHFTMSDEPLQYLQS
jgi:hypothetical protein